MRAVRKYSVSSVGIERRGEHIIKSTLKSVAKYDESTKPGMKVFHLQQLSDSSTDDSTLSRDPRYQELKNQIFTHDVMLKLSVGQMVATCVALGRLHGANKKEWSIIANALKGFCDSDKSSMTPSQICACLYWISKSGNSACVRDRILVSVFKLLLRDSNSWNGIDMGWLMFFLREKHKVDHAAWSRVVRQIAYRFNERLGQMSPKNISFIVYEFSRCHLLPGRAIQRALRFVDQKKSKLDPKTVTLLLMALGNLGVYRYDVVNSLANLVIGKQLERADFRTVATLGYAMAKLDIFHKNLTKAVMERLMRQPAADISNTDLGMLAYTFGRQGLVSNTSEWSRLCEEIKPRIDGLPPQTVAAIVVGMGKSGFVDEEILTKFRRFINKNKRAFSPRQLVNLGHSLNILNQPFDNILVSGVDDERAVFQLNISKLTGCPETDRDFPVMKQITSNRVHQNIYEFLKTNGAEEIALCQQVGGVWVDALFANTDGSKSAMLLTADSDVCKLNNKDLLGPMKWRLEYLERMGFKAIHVSGKRGRSIAHLWDEPALEHLVRSPRPVIMPRRRISPIQVDPETGKVSFR